MAVGRGEETDREGEGMTRREDMTREEPHRLHNPVPAWKIVAVLTLYHAARGGLPVEEGARYAGIPGLMGLAKQVLARMGAVNEGTLLRLGELVWQGKEHGKVKVQQGETPMTKTAPHWEHAVAAYRRRWNLARVETNVAELAAIPPHEFDAEKARRKALKQEMPQVSIADKTRLRMEGILAKGETPPYYLNSEEVGFGVREHLVDWDNGHGLNEGFEPEGR
jgi:hypothetical protein